LADEFILGFLFFLWQIILLQEMNYRAASRAVSRIATPKNYAACPIFYKNNYKENGASPAFYICYKRRMRGKPPIS
jgi:hypothetical protein